jgi:hypothetical protein
LYCNAEDSINEINRRVQAAKIHHGISDAELASLSLAGAEQANLQLLVSEKGIARLNDEGWGAIYDALDELKPDILILDPLVAVLGGASVNDNSAAALMMAQLVRLAATRNMGIVIAHHSSKGKDVTSQEAAMGAATLINLARIALAVDTLKEADALKLGITSDKAKHFFRIVGTKQNLTKPSDQDRWYELCSVKLANAEPPIYPEGDEVGVVQRYTPAPGARAVPKALIDAVLQAVRSADPPLSPTRRSHGAAAATTISRIISTHRGTSASEGEAQSLIDHLIAIGLLRAVKRKIGRKGRGGYERLCLEVVEPVTPPDNAKQKLGDEVAIDGLGASPDATKQ